MTFPTTERRATAVSATSNSTTFTPSWTWNTNNAISDGDIVRWYCFISADGSPSITSHPGWTLETSVSPSSGTPKGIVLYQDTTAAYAASAAPSLTLTVGSNEQYSAVLLAFKISAGASLGTLTTTSADSAGSPTTNSNPPSITNNSGAARDVVVIATRHGDSNVVASSPPTNYGNHQSRNAGGSAGAATNTAERQINIADSGSENPGTYTSGVEDWVCFTVGIYEYSTPPQDLTPSLFTNSNTIHTPIVSPVRWNPVVVDTADISVTTPHWTFTHPGATNWKGGNSDVAYSGDVRIKSLFNSTGTNMLIGFDDTELTSAYYNTDVGSYETGTTVTPFVAGSGRTGYTGMTAGQSYHGIQRRGSTIEFFASKLGDGSDEVVYDSIADPTSGAALFITFAIYENGGQSLGPVTREPVLSTALVTNSPTFPTPTVALVTQFLAPSLYASSQSVFTPTATYTYALAASLYTGGQSFPTPTITVINNLTPSLYSDGDTFFAPTATPGPVGLTPSLFAASNTFRTHTATNLNTLTPSLYTNSQAVQTPTVTPGGATLVPTLFANSQTIQTATLTKLNTLVPSLVTNAQTVPTPTVTASYALAASLFANAQAFHAPAVSALYGLTAALVTNTQTIPTATVAQGPITLATALIANGNAVYEHLIEGGDAPVGGGGGGPLVIELRRRRRVP